MSESPDSRVPTYSSAGSSNPSSDDENDGVDAYNPDSGHLWSGPPPKKFRREESATSSATQELEKYRRKSQRERSSSSELGKSQAYGSTRRDKVPVEKEEDTDDRLERLERLLEKLVREKMSNKTKEAIPAKNTDEQNIIPAVANNSSIIQNATPAARTTDPQKTPATLAKIIASTENTIRRVARRVATNTTAENTIRGLKYTLLADSIPEFVPENPNMTGERWLFIIEQLGEEHGWDDNTKIYLMQSRLRGLARSWYCSLAKTNKCSWNEWKEKLTRAFPEPVDYASLLRKLLDRVKTPEEPMVMYYLDKMEMLKDLDITGNKAVSCIIDGLNNAALKTAAKVGRYETPESLYKEYLCWIADAPPSGEIALEKPEHENDQATKPNRVCRWDVKSLNVDDKVVSNKCSHCNEMGHLNPDCPKLKLVDTKCDQKGHLNKDSPKLEKTLECSKCKTKGHIKEHCPRSKLCNICKSSDHSDTDCPEVKKPSTATKIAESDLTCLVCKKPGHDAIDCPKFPESFCTMCNQCGHLETECTKVKELPMKTKELSTKAKALLKKTKEQSTKTKEKVSTKTKASSTKTDLEQRCSRCKMKGHVRKNCSAKEYCAKCNKFGHLDCSKAKKSSSTTKSTESRRKKCNICKKIGHADVSCPKLQSSKIDSSQKCSSCGETGHRIEECTLLKKKIESLLKCYKCGKKGHMYDTCPAKSFCPVRNRFGHPEKDCPNAKRASTATLNQTEVSCLICGNKGHNQNQCTNSKKANHPAPPPLFCTACKQKGHLGTNCPLAQILKWCFLCNGTGHAASNCTNRWSFCILCNSSGHRNTDCPKAANSNATSAPSATPALSQLTPTPSPWTPAPSATPAPSQLTPAPSQWTPAPSSWTAAPTPWAPAPSTWTPAFSPWTPVNPEPDNLCYRCNERGHIASNCSKPMFYCRVCNNFGHQDADCKNVGGPIESNEQCYNCGDRGHVASKCSKPRLVCKSCNSLGHLKANCTKMKMSSVLVTDSGKKLDMYFVDCTIDGIPSRGYIDSGSEAVTIRETDAINFRLNMRPSGVVIRGFAGGSTKAVAETRARLEVNKVEVDVEALVVSDDLQTIPVMIGQPFVNHPKVVTVIKGNELNIFPEDDHISTLMKLPCTLARWAKKATVIPTEYVGHATISTGDQSDAAVKTTQGQF